MERIRVLIIDLPGMLRDLVQQTIAAQRDMVLVERPEAADDLGAAAEALGAHVVVVQAPSANELSGLDAALYRRPRLKVLGITRDGRSTFLRELCARSVPIGNVGPGELADAIRRAVGERPSEC